MCSVDGAGKFQGRDVGVMSGWTETNWNDEKVKKYIKSLEDNINGKYPAKEETMLNKLEEISSGYEAYKEYMWSVVENNETSYKNKIEELLSEIEILKNLSNEALEIYVLYELLMDLYDFKDQVLDLQRIRSIGNIVSSFASKQNQKEADDGLNKNQCENAE